jgi:peptide/nickel transport system permease protein
MDSIRYVGRRLAFLLPQLFLISVVTFILIRMLPGDPARLELGPLAPQAGVDALRQQLHLDRPIPEQYVVYVGRILHLDFGRSWVTGSSVASDMSNRIPATMELIALGLLVVLLVHVPLGIITASRGGGMGTKVLKQLTFGYGLLAGALPDFWLGLLLLYVFFTKLGMVPGPEGRLSIGETPPPRITGAYTIDSLLTGDMTTLVSSLEHLLLPVLTLSFVYGAPIYKMTRSAMESALRSSYITYMEGFGLPGWKLLWHAFRNAAPPVIIMTGVVSGYLLGGAVLVETVFNLNGLGQYAVQSIASSDYAPIQAFVLIAAIFTMLVYLFVDLVYFAADPRVKAQKRT